jgi:hypothetical protein
MVAKRLPSVAVLDEGKPGTTAAKRRHGREKRRGICGDFFEAKRRPPLIGTNLFLFYLSAHS